MGFIKNIIDRYKFETAITLLMLSWLSNGICFSVFLSLLGYYVAQYYKAEKRRTNFWYDYRAYKTI